MKVCGLLHSWQVEDRSRNIPLPSGHMNNARSRTIALLAAAGAFLLTGCSTSTFSMDEIRAQLTTKPAHLNVLNMLQGTWTTEGTIEFIGQDAPARVTGRSTAEWDCDGRVLIDHSDYDIADFGPMRGVSIWTADEKPGTFQIHWFDSFGETATGTARWEASTRTLKIRTKGKNALCNVVNDGTVRQIDPNTLEWTWEQHDATRIVRYSTMRGTSKRIK
ncbi:MAG: DUF1579 family protein [Phycisphaerae bacterium]